MSRTKRSLSLSRPSDGRAYATPYTIGHNTKPKKEEHNMSRPTDGWTYYNDDTGINAEWSVGDERDGSDDGVLVRMTQGFSTLTRAEWERTKAGIDELFAANDPDDEEGE